MTDTTHEALIAQLLRFAADPERCMPSERIAVQQVIERLEAGQRHHTVTLPLMWRERELYAGPWHIATLRKLSPGMGWAYLIPRRYPTDAEIRTYDTELECRTALLDYLRTLEP